MTRRQSGLAVFQPRARLLKLIGAELISDEVVAITELVKNAHDADASNVLVQFSSGAPAGGEILVLDDGFGMDRETLLGSWMEPAGSSKRLAGNRYTPKGRRVLGEKGLGRFAADKLGSTLELVSRRHGSAAEIRAMFEWDHFDSDTRMLGDITSKWEIRPAHEIKRHGTVLRIGGLRVQWTERMFRRLCTRLSRLRSPFEDREEFSIRIESDLFPQYSGILDSDFLTKAPYRIDARFDGRDGVKIAVNGKARTEQTWNGPALSCGPVRVRLYAFDLETESLAKVGPRMEVRGWLKEWSGVSVYRDGFRLWPYGEPHDDWLRLDQRRVNNPVTKLSNNQVVGFVEISSEKNPELRDQTNREGMIHNPAFEDVRRLMYFVLQVLEADRQSKRHPTVRPGRHNRALHQEADPLVAGLRSLAAKLPRAMANELKRHALQAEELQGKQAELVRKMHEGYSDLAALGQAASGVGEEAPALLDAIEKGLSSLHRQQSKVGKVDGARTVEMLEDIKRLKGRLLLLRTMASGSSHRRRTIEIPVELDACRQLFQPTIEQHGVSFRLGEASPGLLRVDMNPQTLQRIFHVLLRNSLDWLHTTRQPEIKVTARAVGDMCEILFSDNGPGIPFEMAEKVFDPMFSMKEGGRGMGLAIARNLVTMHGGEIRVICDARRKGAALEVLLPRKRSRTHSS